MKKSIALLCTLLLLIGLVAGCATATPTVTTAGPTTTAGGTTAATTAGPTTTAAPTVAKKLAFWAWTNPDNMKPLTEQFNKDYAGKYELVYQKLADAATLTINTALASGEQIDVMTQSGAFDLRQRADDGIYLPLKQFFDAWGTTYAKEFGESTEIVQNIDGDYYSLPYCKNIQMVYFNENMFTAAGVPFPAANWTWSDFQETAKKLTTGEGANKVYGAMADLLEYWPMVAYQKLGAFWYYSEDKTKTRFDNGAMKEGMQLWYDMVMVDKTTVPYDEYMTLKYNNDTNGMIGLYNNKYAMWLAPVYGCLYTNESYGKIPAGTKIGIANMPIPNGTSKSVTSFYTSTASIPANVKDKEASWTLLKYICVDRADLFAGPKAMHPGYDFADKSKRLDFEKMIFNHPGIDQPQCLKLMALDRQIQCQDNTYVIGQAKINDLIKSNATLVFQGELSVDDCLKTLKTEGDKAIAADLKK